MTEPPIFKLRAFHCPTCGKKQTAVSESADDFDGRAPQPDDITICIDCGEPAAFNADMSLRLLTQAEHASLEPDVKAGIARAKALVRAAAGHA